MSTIMPDHIKTISKGIVKRRLSTLSTIDDLVFVWNNMEYFPDIYTGGQDIDSYKALIEWTTYYFKRPSHNIFRKMSADERYSLLNKVIDVWYSTKNSTYGRFNMPIISTSSKPEFDIIVCVLFAVLDPYEQKHFLENNKAVVEWLRTNTQPTYFYQGIRPEIFVFAIDWLNKNASWVMSSVTPWSYFKRDTFFHRKYLTHKNIVFTQDVIDKMLEYHSLRVFIDELTEYCLLSDDVYERYKDEINPNYLMKNHEFELRGKNLDYINESKLKPTEWIRWTYLPVEFIRRFPMLINPLQLQRWMKKSYFSPEAIDIITNAHGEPKFKSKTFVPKEAYTHRRLGVYEMVNEIMPNIPKSSIAEIITNYSLFTNLELREKLQTIDTLIME